jgi:methyl-accepting chemotaxis protein
MPNKKKLAIRYQILGGYSIPVILSMISGVIIFFQVQNVRKEITNLERGIKIEQNIGELGINVQILSRAARGYILEKSQTSEESFKSAQKAIQEYNTIIDSLIEDEQQRETFDNLKIEVSALEKINVSLMESVNRGLTRDQVIEQWKTNNARAEAERVSELLTEFKEREEEIISISVQNKEVALNNLIFVLISATVLSLALSVTLGLTIVAGIAKQMNETANLMATSSNEIATTVEQQERTASEQAASVNETTTTMEELGASSRQSAQQADSASNAASQALEMTEMGNRTVNTTLEKMENLKDKVGAIAQQIILLSEQTNQIGNISQLVSDIANQTNMLALNASVEAVRAGEHGKGFSVVAAEIRKLADQSRQSAEKINLLVTEIQKAINSTVIVTDEGTKTVDQGMDMTKETAQAFAGVADSVNNVVMNNQQISLNIRQQVTAIEQVVSAMNIINQGAKETATGITQTRTGVEQLNQAAEELKTLV